jgi:hypothetical protein
MVYGWAPDWPDGFGQFYYIVDGAAISPAGNTNLSELNDPVVNNLLTKFGNTPDNAARNALTSQIDMQVMKDAAILPGITAKNLLYRPHERGQRVRPAQLRHVRLRHAGGWGGSTSGTSTTRDCSLHQRAGDGAGARLSGRAPARASDYIRPPPDRHGLPAGRGQCLTFAIASSHPAAGRGDHLPARDRVRRPEPDDPPSRRSRSSWGWTLRLYLQYGQVPERAWSWGPAQQRHGHRLLPAALFRVLVPQPDPGVAADGQRLR